MGTMPEAGLSALASDVSKVRTAPFQKIFMFRAVCFFVLLAFLHVYADSNPHQGYSASGILTYTAKRTDGRILINQEWHFELSEHANGKWEMEVSTKYPNPSIPIETTSYLAYNGYDIYSVVYSSNRIDVRDGRIEVVQGNGEYPGRVSSGPYPIDHSSAVGALWLAFISGRYLPLSGEATNLPNLLVTDARKDPSAWTCQFEYELTNSNARRLLFSGRYLKMDGYIRSDPQSYAELDFAQTGEELDNLLHAFKQYSELTGDQRLRASYNLLSSTNIEGIMIPLEFECVLAPLPGRSDLAGGQLAGRITSVHFSTGVLQLPPIHGKIQVEDMRMRVKDPEKWRRSVYYYLDDSKWITDTNSAVIQESVARSPFLPTAISSGAKQRLFLRRVILGVFGLATAFTVIFLIRHKRRYTKTVKT